MKLKIVLATILRLHAGKERDVIMLNSGALPLLVFAHGIERSMLPLICAVGDCGDKFKERLKMEFDFLVAKHVGGMERYAPVLNSIKLKGRPTLSVHGAEDPGSYGLDKESLMTIVAAKDN